MKIKHLLLLFTAIITLSCSSDDSKESIDYVQVTQERLVAVSEKEFIVDDDISSLERLIDKVDSSSDKQRFKSMLEDIKKIKDVIPDIVKLKTDDDIDFTSFYSATELKVNQIGDVFARKEKLKQDLLDAKESYESGEVVFDNTPHPEFQNIPGISKRFISFLKENYGIEPLSEDGLRFKRSDIDRVDSLVAHTWASNVLKFKNLRFLETGGYFDTKEVDLNKLKKLEKLISTSLSVPIKVDGCDNLQELTIQLYKFKESLDFSKGNPKLKYFELQITFESLNSLQELVIKNKPSLEKIEYFVKDLTSVGKIEIEGNNNTIFVTNRSIGLKTPEIGELKMSNMREINIDSWAQDGKGKVIGTFIGKLDIDNNPNLEKLNINNTYLPIVIDVAKYPKLNTFIYTGSSYNPEHIPNLEKPLEKSILKNNIKNFDKLPSDIIELGLTEMKYESTTLDLSRFKNLNKLRIGKSYYGEGVKLQSLEKLILDRSTYERMNAEYNFSYAGIKTHNVELILVN